jgi:hypothetical protein
LKEGRARNVRVGEDTHGSFVEAELLSRDGIDPGQDELEKGVDDERDFNSDSFAHPFCERIAGRAYDVRSGSSMSRQKKGRREGKGSPG